MKLWQSKSSAGRLSVKGHRSRIYRVIRERGVRGLGKNDVNATVQSTNASDALEGLIADGWIFVEDCFRGDGSVYCRIYFASDQGRGEHP